MQQRPYKHTSNTGTVVMVLVGLVVVTCILNGIVTQSDARLMGYSARLGAPLFWHVYSPFTWIKWAIHWWSYKPLHPVFIGNVKATLWPFLLLSYIGLMVVVFSSGNAWRSDLYGSARWARRGDVYKAELLPRWWQRALKPGIILGQWGRQYLSDRGEGHVLLFAPTRGGKGAGLVIPTLLTWPASTVVHDLKGENWALTSGWRKAQGHIALKFDPTDASGASVKFNPLDEVRLRTNHETEDVQNIAHMIMDPDGKGLNDHWLKTGFALLVGTIMHVLYAEPDKTLAGVLNFLTDPRRERKATVEYMLRTNAHPVVAGSIREYLDKAANEASGVASTALSFLALYRDPVVVANTSRSEFHIDDLMNHERPISLYLVVPLASSDRLRPLLRLVLNQIVRHFTPAMEYRNGRAAPRYRHQLLMMIDEFATLGRFEMFAKTLSLIAGYGIRACLLAQDLSQIQEAYGPKESITANCATVVAFTPNKYETAKALSDRAGGTTVRYRSWTHSSRNDSISEPYTRRQLITPEEVLQMDSEAELVMTTGHPPIIARKIRHWQDSHFSQRVLIDPPKTSDRIIEPVVSAELERTPEISDEQSTSEQVGKGLGLA